MTIHTTPMLIRALGALLAAWSFHACAGPLLSVAPASMSISRGQSFAVNIAIHDVTDLFAYQFDLAFNPALLSVTSVDELSFLPGGGATIFFPGIIDNAAGRLSFTLGTLADALGGVSGTGDLVRVGFQARDTLGSTAISLSNIILLDSQLADIAFEPAVNGQVAVVPEPGTAALAGPFLLWLVWAFRCRRADPLSRVNGSGALRFLAARPAHPLA